MIEYVSTTTFKTGLVGIIIYVIDIDQIIIIQRNGEGFLLEVNEKLSNKMMSKVAESVQIQGNSIFLDYIENI